MSTADLRLRVPPDLSTPRASATRIILSWMGVTLLSFPIAGYIGWVIAGPVDGVVPALLGGALTGAGVGLGQWLLLRRDLDIGPSWILATAGALAVGLAIGAAAVGYETTAGSLAAMGAITGGAVGVAQGVLLRRTFSLWFVWMAAIPLLWAAGWLATEAGGIDVAQQFTVFGAYGTIPFGALSALLLVMGKRRPSPLA